MQHFHEFTAVRARLSQPASPAKGEKLLLEMSAKVHETGALARD
jgi:hypothetical protein